MGIFPFMNGIRIVKLRGHLSISEIRNAYITPYSFNLLKPTGNFT
jgi:hypothetical protein